MRLVRFSQFGTERVGLIDHIGAIHDISTILPEVSRTTIGSPGWKRAAVLRDFSGFPSVSAEDVSLGPCLADIGKLVCLGLNDKTHAQQLGLDGDVKPLIFLKPQSAITGAHGPVTYPKIGKEMDWETELMIVIGARCKYVHRDNALSVVAGYCIHNDLSDRTWQKDQKGGLTALNNGKSFDTFAPVGPWLVTPDEIGDPNALNVKLRVNGEVRQDFNTRDYILDVQGTIEFCSQFFTLYPGDVISMGSGPGNGGQWGKYLQVGDHVEAEIEGLGRQDFVIGMEE